MGKLFSEKAALVFAPHGWGCHRRQSRCPPALSPAPLCSTQIAEATVVFGPLRLGVSVVQAIGHSGDLTAR